MILGFIISYFLFIGLIVLFFMGATAKEKTEIECQYCGLKITPVQITIWLNDWEGRCPKCNEIINWNLAKKESKKKHN